MEYKKFGGVYAVRMDKGEEILAKLKEFTEREKVAFARVSAIGAVGSFTAGVFDTKTKQYRANEFEGNFEIVSQFICIYQWFETAFFATAAKGVL